MNQDRRWRGGGRGGGPSGSGRGGPAGRPRINPGPSTGGGRAFPKAPAERTFHAQDKHKRLEKQQAREQQYLHVPAQGLISAKLVLPTRVSLPMALDEPNSLDSVRLGHKVWITFEKLNVLVVHAHSSSRLQQALEAIHWKIHDMRLAEELEMSRFLDQGPLAPNDNGAIIFRHGQRPHIAAADPEVTMPLDTDYVLSTLWENLGFDLVNKAETLMGIAQVLRMRINFGRLNILRKADAADELTREQFQKELRAVGKRGHASLGKRMPDAHKARAVLKALVDPANSLKCNATDLVRRYSLILHTEQGHIETELDPLPHVDFGVSVVQGTLTEDWARLNWTVAAPDTLFDWNIEVRASETLDKVPSDLTDFLQRLKIQRPNTKASDKTLMLPRVSTKDAKQPDTMVKSSQMKSSVLMTLAGGDYIVEVSLTRQYDGVDFDGPSTITWEVQLYGKRWEEAVNTMSSDGRRKDWGKDLVEVWPGAKTSLKDRFKSFLRTVLEIQALLTRVTSDEDGG